MGVINVTDPNTGAPIPIMIAGDEPTAGERQRINAIFASRNPAPVEAAPEEENSGGFVTDTAVGSARGFLGSFAQMPGGIGALGESALGYDVGSTRLGGGLASLSDMAQAPIDKYLPAGDSIGSKTGQAIGSIASFFVPGALAAKGAAAAGAGVLGQSVAAGSAASAMGAALGADEQLARIEQQLAQGKEVDDAVIRQAVLSGGAVGLSEGIPIGSIGAKTFGLLRKVPREAKEQALLTIGRRLKRAGATGLTEGAQEVFAGISQDLIEQGLYNEDVEVGNSAADEFIYGGGAGAGLQFILDSVAGRRISTGVQLRDDLREDFQQAQQQKDFAEQNIDIQQADDRFTTEQAQIAAEAPARRAGSTIEEQAAQERTQSVFERIKANNEARAAAEIKKAREVQAQEAIRREADQQRAVQTRGPAPAGTVPVGTREQIALSQAQRQSLNKEQIAAIKADEKARKELATELQSKANQPKVPDTNLADQYKANQKAAHEARKKAEDKWKADSTERQRRANEKRNAEIAFQKQAARNLKKVKLDPAALQDARVEKAKFTVRPKSDTSGLAVSAGLGRPGRALQSGTPAPVEGRGRQATPEQVQAMRDALDTAGFKDVSMSLVPLVDGDASIEGVELRDAQGSAIELATNIYDPNLSDAELTMKLAEVMNHEIVHAARTLDLYNSDEFSSLAKAASSQKRVGPDGKKRKYSYLDYQVAKMQATEQQLSPDVLIEEAVAEMYRDFAAGRLKVSGRPNSLWQKLLRFIKAIGTAGRSLKTDRGADVMSSMGEIAKRERGVKRMGSRSGKRYARALDMFHSPLLTELSKKNTPKAQASDWINVINKLPGVKKDEVEWLGVEDWLKDQPGPINKDDLLNFIGDHQITIYEHQLGGDGESDVEEPSYGIQEGDIIEPDEDWLDEETKYFISEYGEDYAEEARQRNPYNADEWPSRDVYEDEISANVAARARGVAYENYYEDEDAPREVTFIDYGGSGEDFDGVSDRSGRYIIPELGLDDLTLDDAYDALAKVARETMGTGDNRFDGPHRHIEYTEEGGDDYREIVLSVPALNKQGKNRQSLSEEEQKEWDRINKEIKEAADKSEWNRYRDLLEVQSMMATPKASPDEFVVPSHFEQPNVIVHARVKDRSGPGNENILFVEEVQSDLASYWRGRKIVSEQDIMEKDQVLQRLINDQEAMVNEVRSEFLRDKGDALEQSSINFYTTGQAFPDAIRTWSNTAENRLAYGEPFFQEFNNWVNEDITGDRNLKALRITEREDEITKAATAADEAQYEFDNQKKKVKTPFQQEAAYALMVKRLVREAADQGYDAVAWTPGYMQAERWSAAGRSVIDSVTWYPPEANNNNLKWVAIGMQGGNAYDVFVDQETGIIKSGDYQVESLIGESLSSVLSPAIANQIMSEDQGTVSGQRFMMPGSGYKVAYDQQIKRAFEKIAKKSKAKVRTEGNLPDFSSDTPEVDRAEWLYGNNLDNVMDIVKRIKEMRVPLQEAGFMDPEHNLDLVMRIDDPVFGEKHKGSVVMAVTKQGIFDIMYPDADVKTSRPVWIMEMNEDLVESAKQTQAMFSKKVTKEPLSPEAYAKMSGGMDRRYSRAAGDVQSPETSGEALEELDISVQYAKSNDWVNKTIGKIFPSHEAGLKDASVTFQQNFQDRLLPIGKIIDDLRAQGHKITDMLDIYRQEEVMHGDQGARLSNAEQELFSPIAIGINRIELDEAQVKDLMDQSGFANRMITMLRNEQGGIKGAYNTFMNRTAPERMGAVDAYLYALHAKERNAYLLSDSDGKKKNGSGMTDLEADRILRWVSNLPPETQQSFSAVRDAVRNVVAETNAVRIKGGLIKSSVAVDNFTDYVPLRGRLDEDGYLEESTRSETPTKNLGAAGREDPYMLGRKDYAAISPLRSTIVQHQQSILRDERNKVIQTAQRLIEAFPKEMNEAGMRIKLKVPTKETKSSTGKRVTVPDINYAKQENVVPFKVDGETLYLEVDSKHLQRAFKSLKAGDVTKSIMRNMQTFMRAMSAVRTTYSPEFLVSNAARDVQIAMFNSLQFDVEGLQKDIVKGVPNAARAVNQYMLGKRSSEKADYSITDPSKEQQLARVEEFVNSGGKNILLQMGTAEQMMGNIEHLMGRINNDIENGKDFKSRMLGRGGSMLHLIERWNEAAENMSRVSTYNALRSRGVSAKQAAQAARNVTTNFSKKGIYGEVLNTTYLFYNAALQGSMASINAAARSPKARKALGGIIALGVMMDQINNMLSPEDEDGVKSYDQMFDYTLEHNLVFMIPGSDNKAVTIPLPYGLNMFFNMGRISSKYLRGAATAGEVASSLGSSVLETFWPFGGSEHSPLTLVAPTVMDPAIELLSNKSWSGAPIYKEAFPNDPGKARSWMHWNSTSKSAQSIAKTVNDITGGTSVIPGYVDMSPDVIDYWINFFTASTGRFLQRAVETPFIAADVFQGTWMDDSWNEIPITRKVFQTVSDRSVSSDYFEKFDKLRLYRAEVQEAAEVGDIPRWEKAKRKYSKELALYSKVNIINNSRRKLVTSRNKILARTDMTNAQKEKVAKVLREREVKLMRKALGIMEGI